MNALTWIDAVGLAAFAMNVAGNFMLTSQKSIVRGHWVRLATNVVQVAYAVLLGSMPYTAQAAVFAGINVVGIVRWSRVAKKREAS